MVRSAELSGGIPVGSGRIAWVSGVGIWATSVSVREMYDGAVGLRRHHGNTIPKLVEEFPACTD